MTSSTTKAKAKQMASVLNMPHAAAVSKVREGLHLVYEFQPATMANGVLPWPILAEADGSLRRQAHFAGAEDRVFAFADRPEPSAAADLLHWREYVKGDPQAAVGRYVVTAALDGRWFTHTTPIEHVDVATMTTPPAHVVEMFEQAAAEYRDRVQPIPDSVEWKINGKHMSAVIFRAVEPGLSNDDPGLSLTVTAVREPEAEAGKDPVTVYVLRFTGFLQGSVYDANEKYATLADVYENARMYASDIAFAAREETSPGADYWDRQERTLQKRAENSEAVLTLTLPDADEKTATGKVRDLIADFNQMTRTARRDLGSEPIAEYDWGTDQPGEFVVTGPREFMVLLADYATQSGFTLKGTAPVGR